MFFIFLRSWVSKFATHGVPLCDRICPLPRSHPAAWQLVRAAAAQVERSGGAAYIRCLITARRRQLWGRRRLLCFQPDGDTQRSPVTVDRRSAASFVCRQDCLRRWRNDDYEGRRWSWVCCRGGGPAAGKRCGANWQKFRLDSRLFFMKNGELCFLFNLMVFVMYIRIITDSPVGKHGLVLRSCGSELF